MKRTPAARIFFLATATLWSLVTFTAASASESDNCHKFSGQASWYGGELEGHKTASGQRFHKNSLVAAHRSLPFGTKILVKNCRTGHACVVEVADRGPHIRGRVIDVSKEAARRLHLISAGVGKVECRVLSHDDLQSQEESELIATVDKAKMAAK